MKFIFEYSISVMADIIESNSPAEKLISAENRLKHSFDRLKAALKINSFPYELSVFKKKFKAYYDLWMDASRKCREKENGR